MPEEKHPSGITDDVGLPRGGSLNGLTPTPDSVLSGPLDVGDSPAPNTADSVAPTSAFPRIPISRASTPFTSPEPDDRDVVEAKTNAFQQYERRSRRRELSSASDNKAVNAAVHKAFGSLVSLDDDDPHFLSTSITEKH